MKKGERSQPYICGSGWQGQQVVSDGIGRAAETEEDIDAMTAREFVTDPNGLLKLNSDLIKSIQRYDILQHNRPERQIMIACVTSQWASASHSLHVPSYVSLGVPFFSPGYCSILSLCWTCTKGAFMLEVLTELLPTSYSSCIQFSNF